MTGSSRPKVSQPLGVSISLMSFSSLSHRAAISNLLIPRLNVDCKHRKSASGGKCQSERMVKVCDE